MKIDELKIILRQLIQEVSESNFNEYYEKFAQPILEYRKLGGLGKPLTEYLIELDKQYGSDSAKEEILLDTSNRIIGQCPSNRSLTFTDLVESNSKK